MFLRCSSFHRCVHALHVYTFLETLRTQALTQRRYPTMCMMSCYTVGEVEKLFRFLTVR